MNTLSSRVSQARSANIRATLARMVDGAVFELPARSMRDRFVNVQKVISWRQADGSVALRTYDESMTKDVPRWSIDPDGRLLDGGISTMWFISDLRPTGENAVTYIMDNLPDDDEDEAPARVIPLRRAPEQAL